MKVDTLIKFRKNKLFSKIIHSILLKKGIDLPSSVKLGKNVSFPHNSIGTVIHPNTVIEDNVKVYQNVTIGHADVYKDISESRMKRIIIKKGAILGAGCKILSKDEELIVGKNTIIGANAVLLSSTGDNEIWVGIPAKKIAQKSTITKKEKKK